MNADDDARQGFSTKEMLIRVDGKIDTVLGRQQHYEVEQALIKARLDIVEATQRGTAAWRDEIRAELASHGRKLAYGAGAVASIILIGNLAVPLLFH